MEKNSDPKSTISGDLSKVLLRALEQSPSIVLVTDLKGIIEYVNPQFCELTGYAQEDILNKNIRCLKSGQMSPEFYSGLWKTIREKDEWRGELHNRRKTGELYWESAVISTVRNEDGVAEHYLKVAEDITRLKKAEEQRDKLMDEMRVMAMQDALTGLYSRRMFDDELNRAWLNSERHDVSTGLLVIDIDFFKSFNDTYGHQVGDKILVEAARLVESTARSGHIVCRYGGDEIVVILPMTSLDATAHVGMRLVKAVREHVFCEENHKLEVTFSIGAAAGSGRSEPAQSVLMRADQALYHAKRHGRNVLAVYDPNTTPQLTLLEKTEMDDSTDTRRRTRQSKPQIMVVTSDVSVSDDICAALNPVGFDTKAVKSPEEAVACMQDAGGTTDIVIMDRKLRRKGDADPLMRMWKLDDALSAVVIVESPDDAVPMGATGKHSSVGFASKPLTEKNLIPAIDQALKKRNFLLEERRYRQTLQHMVSQQSTKLRNLVNSSRETQQPVAQLMTVIFDAYERKTGEHCQRSEKIARIIASEMNLAQADREAIERGSFLHDIGKIGIPDSILMKKSPLTLEEWKTIRLHPLIGYDLLKDQPAFEGAARIVLEHHERYDGSGYPDGKKGSQISVGARIFAVADTYDAIRADRVYTATVPPDKALVEITSNRGTLFDPDVVDSFARCQKLIEAEVFDQA